MKREAYLDLSVDYFKGQISFKELCVLLEAETISNVESIKLPEKERVMLISNHPGSEKELDIPTENIAGYKGGNTFNFPTFWFPAIRQAILRKVLKRRFFTIAYDIGWSEAMQEMNHLLIKKEEGGRTQEIISKMERDSSSIVIFPEGGVRNLEIFKTGFFHIACSLNIKHLVVGVFRPVNITLRKENSFQILEIIDMSNLIKSVSTFVYNQQKKIKEALS